MAMTRLMARALLDARVAELNDDDPPQWRRYGSHATNRMRLYRMICPATGGYQLTEYGRHLALAVAAVADSCQFASCPDDDDPTCQPMDQGAWTQARHHLEHAMCALSVLADPPVTVVVVQLTRSRFEREVAVAGHVVWHQPGWTSIDPAGRPEHALRDAAAAAAAAYQTRLPAPVVQTLTRLAADDVCPAAP